MPVPNTDTFSLQDVKTEIESNGGTATNTLVSAFTNAIPSGFDSLHEGTKDRLLNFRNYGHGTAPAYGVVNSTTTLPSAQACSTGPEFTLTLPFYFNQNVGGVTGYRLGESYSGATAQTLRIFSFTEVQKEYNPATFNESDATVITIDPGTESSLNNLGSAVTSFPVDIDLTTRVGVDQSISDLSVSVLKTSNCPSVSGLNTARERIIEFAIIDSNGLAGPTLTINFTYRRPAGII